MYRRDKITFFFILALFTFAILLLAWAPLGKALDRESFVLGLDLKGGAYLIYQADLSQAENPEEAIKGVIDVIEKRINAYGVTEPVIRQMGRDRILVQLPGIEKVQEAKKLIGQTALIKFKEPQMSTYFVYQVNKSEADLSQIKKQLDDFISQKYGVKPTVKQLDEVRIRVEIVGRGLAELKNLTEEIQQASLPLKLESSGEAPVLDEKGKPVWIPAKGVYKGGEVELTSRLFKGNTAVVLNQMTNEPEVAFEWNKEGAAIFEQITKRLFERPYVEGSPNWQRRLGIFLGDEYLSAPVVQAVIKGRGVITGLDLKEAQWLSRLLNAGRIPVPLHTIEEHDVSPTLGANFIEWSLRAGAIGLLMVILFMILYYRLPGLMAGLALIVYTALVLAAFKLIPVTMTLAGIAGFVLSIGMAVDANVLIFERMKEELRGGRTLRASIEVGFDRAWPAIRDANITTFISCGILYWMGSRLAVPAVMGFSLTLFIGVAISMFSALVVTRNFLRLLGGTGVVKRPALLIPGR